MTLHHRINRFFLPAFVPALAATAAVAQSPTETRPDHPRLVTVASTNWTPCYLTNHVVVTMPNNVFVDEYRTNWFEQRVTNYLDVFRTNVVGLTLTNTVPVEKIQTNIITAYQTNLKSLTLTNWEPVVVFQTNWVTKPFTNIVTVTNTQVAERLHTNVVVAYQTNLVTAYQTNLKTLTLTNWETVLVMRTNWITQPATNVVQIELPSPASTVAAAPAKIEAPTPAEPKKPAAPVDLGQKMEFELTPIGQATKPGQFPIQLALRTVGEPRTVLPVHEWRVERTDGSFLLLGSRPEFTATLPSGAYKILARIRHDDSSPMQNIRGTIQVAGGGDAQRTPALVGASGR